ncbi:hypothetical protein LVJ82_01070 [Vitreoscilla massiliensis]|uniref:Uncharacterized protein n=1 Tax=Vitreoscilla massiliensis TaxID=1689272 RepID=A0ABY4E1C9_9NEIS|nr:hypothetical protein [Vitreoscilla massiliensis]UOO89606.1 hypothetical protein LVJ82_01070 [Vitreoscilla massiliensis]
MTIEFAFNILMSIVAAAIGLIVRRLFTQVDDMQKLTQQMRVDYQSREQALLENQTITKALDRIEQKLERVNDKLDRKADK